MFFSIKVCEGPYDPVLLKAWETWDTEHGSENDHPKQFPENQVCIVLQCNLLGSICIMLNKVVYSLILLALLSFMFLH